MKYKFSVILLAFYLIGPILTSYIWINYKTLVIRKQVKKQIIAGIDKEDLVLFITGVGGIMKKVNSINSLINCLPTHLATIPKKDIILKNYRNI